VAALHSPHRLALLQWIPMQNYVSPYAAVPADGGSAIHAFTQKLVPAEESAELEAPDLGYGYHRLQKRAVFYRKRLAALNAELHNRVYYAYRKHLLQRGFLRPAATSVAYLQSEVDALKAHVTQLAQELDEKDELSAHMAGLQSQALAKVMSRVHHLASLVHASALHRIRVPSPAPPTSHHAAAKASTSDLKWMHQLSRALSVIQAQSIHQAKMMRHVASLSREVEELRQRLLRKRRRYRARIGHDHLRGRRHVELRSSSVRSNAGNHDETPAAGASPSARKQKLNSLLDQVEAVKMHNPASPTLDGLYHEIHALQSLLATLPSGPQKL
jgi:cell division septum initiation protein DivIVA